MRRGVTDESSSIKTGRGERTYGTCDAINERKNNFEILKWFCCFSADTTTTTTTVQGGTRESGPREGTATSSDVDEPYNTRMRIFYDVDGNEYEQVNGYKKKKMKKIDLTQKEAIDEIMKSWQLSLEKKKK